MIEHTRGCRVAGWQDDAAARPIPPEDRVAVQRSRSRGRRGWGAGTFLALVLGGVGCAPLDAPPVRLDPMDSGGFSEAFRSPEALIRTAVARGSRSDVVGVWRTRITREEYEAILWPELPERRDGPVEFFWAMMEGRHRKGARALVGEVHGGAWEVVRIEWTDEPAVYPSFTIHKFPEVTVRSVTDGSEMVLHHITGIVEWNGLFKVFSFRD